MKTFKTTIVISYLVIGFTNAQIDTTDWFPMQNGNYWEYSDRSGTATKLFIEIMGDTILNNGEEYKVFRYYFNDWFNFSDYYYRKDQAGKIFIYSSAPGCINYERVLYDFKVQDSTIWKDCIAINNLDWHRALYQTSYVYFQFYFTPVLSKAFTYVTVDTSVVPFDTSWFALGSEKIAKGIGIYESLFDQAPWYNLVGAIINNQRYGLITNISENDIGNNDSEKTSISVYPNPFNSQCRVTLINPSYDNNEIIVYNSLGEKLFEINKEFKLNNSHSFDLDLRNYPSGIYFLCIRNDQKFIINKLINLK